MISGNNLLAFCERELPGEYGGVSEKVVKYFYFLIHLRAGREETDSVEQEKAS